MLQFIMRHHPTEKVQSLLTSAGYHEASPLQEEYVPAALQGKDLIVESISGEGKTVAQLLPFFLQPKTRKKAPAFLILVDTVEAAGKYERELSRFASAKTKIKQSAVLGKEPQAKHELRTLTKRPGLIVGTTGRIIDHIRRNNLRLNHLSTVLINVPENGNHTEFARDVEFIMTKAPKKVQTVVFTPAVEKAEELSYLLKRPATLTAAERQSKLPSLHIYKCQKRTPPMLSQLIFGLDLSRVLLVTATTTESRQVQDSLQHSGISCCQVLGHEIESGSHSALQEFPQLPDTEQTVLRCEITTFQDAPRIQLSSFKAILFYGLPQNQ
ncbi:MAG: DEAD/DEAH box helicase [Spirochaetia bacterium]|nr:DEAD/DEAH box helicase [Spirochaetia bacterium]